MEYQTLIVKAQRQQLFSMFFLRGLIFSTKNFILVVVLLCAIFVLSTCKHPVKEGQNQLVFEACSPSDTCDGYVSSEFAKHFVQQHNLHNLCPLTGCLVNKTITESKDSHASVGFPSVHLNGRTILCTLYQKDDFHDNIKRSDVSSCISPINCSKSGQYIKLVKSGFLEGLSVPPVEIRPELLDWGDKNIYHPSLAFLTVKNLDSDSVLSIYDPYSSNPQFYICNFTESEISLDPGEETSLCFVFFPTQLGVASGQLVLQTNFGGFLIQAKGLVVESPYLIKPLSGIDISFNGRWRKNLSLFNPFNDVLYVQNITVWISGNTLNCSVHNMEDLKQYSLLSAKDWLILENSEMAPEISVRPRQNWEIGPKKRKTIMELDVSYNFEGKVIGSFCLQLARPSENEIDTVMVPLKAELLPMESVSVSVEALVPLDESGYLVAALSVRNESPNIIRFVKVGEVGESNETFHIKSVEGLVLFPHTIVQVAILNYDHPESYEVNMNCQLLVQLNETRNSEIQIPCKDVISVCSGQKNDYSTGHTEAVDTKEADEFVPQNLKFQVPKSLMSVLDTSELLFPTVHIGDYVSKWITIKNPSPEPVLMQLILDSKEIIKNCKKTEMIFEPFGNKKSFAPTKYGFSVAKDGLTKAFVHPYGVASFGPILFQPSNQCEWRSSVFIRNNLSGIEWLSLRGFGDSVSMVLLEGPNSVQSLEFNLNLPAQLNDTIYSSAPSCSQFLIKEVQAKNNGDFPLEVVKIGVSGVECGIDRFRINNCNGFSLEPGESARVQISYETDFSAATVQRDLELVLPAGILVIPMKVNLPIYELNFCKRTVFMMWVKKAAFMLVFATLLFLLVYLMFPYVTAEDFIVVKNSFSTHALNSLYFLKKSSSMATKIEKFIGSTDEKETLILESASRHSDGQSQPESGLESTEKLKSISVENSEIQDLSDSKNLRVKIGKEKRRRKKRRSCVTGAVLFEVSSSHSSNSTPSSPLSSVLSITPRKPWSVSPAEQKLVETKKNPFAKSPYPKSRISELSSNVNFSANEATLGLEDNKRVFLAQEKLKVAVRAVQVPSMMFPNSDSVVPNWSCDSPVLVSKSTIAPYARAPGTKLHCQKTEEHKGVEDKFIYDIWGDHLFGLPLTQKVLSNDSHSFFVRDTPTLMRNSLLKPVMLSFEGTKLASIESDCGYDETYIGSSFSTRPTCD